MYRKGVALYIRSNTDQINSLAYPAKYLAAHAMNHISQPPELKLAPVLPDILDPLFYPVTILPDLIRLFRFILRKQVFINYRIILKIFPYRVGNSQGFRCRLVNRNPFHPPDSPMAFPDHPNQAQEQSRSLPGLPGSRLALLASRLPLTRHSKFDRPRQSESRDCPRNRIIIPASLRTGITALAVSKEF